MNDTISVLIDSSVTTVYHGFTNSSLIALTVISLITIYAGFLILRSCLTLFAKEDPKKNVWVYTSRSLQQRQKSIANLIGRKSIVIKKYSPVKIDPSLVANPAEIDPAVPARPIIKIKRSSFVQSLSNMLLVRLVFLPFRFVIWCIKILYRLCCALVSSTADETDSETNNNASDPRQPIKVLCVFDITENTVMKDVRRFVKNMLVQQVPDQFTLEQIVIRITSPGGSVTFYGQMYTELLRLRTHGFNLVVCVDQIAASGGYLVACCANKICAAPFSIVGSVGVVSELPNYGVLADKVGVTMETFTSGDKKRVYNHWGANSEETKQIVMGDLKVIHDQFIDTVMTHRPQVNRDEMKSAAVWTGVKAKEIGLVDEIMSSDDYIMSHSETHQIVRYKVKNPNQLTNGLLGYILSTVAPPLMKWYTKISSVNQSSLVHKPEMLATQTSSFAHF
jgi:signal peptide peptidase SppA